MSAIVATWTSLVGRSAEVERVVRTVRREERLVVLVGLGGIGKTRVARAAAVELAHEHRVEVVDAVGLTDGRELGIALDAWLDALGPAVPGQRDVLVVDNVEPLLPDGAEVISERLARAPRLSIIATSRVPLGCAGEALMWIGPLGVEGPTSPAVELVLARAVATGAEAWHSDRAGVERLARHLDGVPLALELAAGVAHLVTPDELVAALSASSPGGAGEAGATRDAAIDWAWRRLPRAHKEHLIALAVIDGPFDFALVMGLGSGDLDVRAQPGFSMGLDALERLVATSLVMREPGADSRYRILESVRRFALAQATPEAIEAARDRFATALLARFPLDTSVSRFFPTVPPIAEAHRHALLAILRRGQQHGTPRALGRAFEAAVLLSESAVGAIIGPAIFEDVAALLERAEAASVPRDVRLRAGLFVVAFASASHRRTLCAATLARLEVDASEDPAARFAVRLARLWPSLYAWDYAALAEPVERLGREPAIGADPFVFNRYAQSVVWIRRALGRADADADDALLARAAAGLEAVGSERAALINLTNRAFLAIQLGRHAPGCDMARRASARFEALGLPFYVALAHREEARAEIDLGCTGEGLARLDRALVLFEAQRTIERIETELDRAAAALEAGRYDEVGAVLTRPPEITTPFIDRWLDALAAAHGALVGRPREAVARPPMGVVEDAAIALLLALATRDLAPAIAAATAAAPWSTRVRQALRLATRAEDLVEGRPATLGVDLGRTIFRLGPTLFDLGRKPQSAALLAHLAERRLEGRPAATKAELATVLWPDERIPVVQRDMRLHAAVRALRQDGLEVIAAEEGGFALDRPALIADIATWTSATAPVVASRGRGRPRRG